MHMVLVIIVGFLIGWAVSERMFDVEVEDDRTCVSYRFDD